MNLRVFGITLGKIIIQYLVMHSLSKVFSILTITGIFLLGVACESEQRSSASQPEQYGADEAVPLIYHMSFLQQYSQKLYLSGKAQNWELADIYSHEIEEISEMIAEGNFTHDEINLSQLMESMLLPQIERMEDAIDSQSPEQFEAQFNTLIQTCNQCHQASDYDAVNIAISDKNPFNQDFSPASE